MALCLYVAQRVGQLHTMTPQEYVQQKAANSGSSFYYAFLFLPANRRAAITAFYAFCREVDDVVDEISDPSVAQSTLAWWQNEVLQSFTGSPTHPVMKALMVHANPYGIESTEHVPLGQSRCIFCRWTRLNYGSVTNFSGKTLSLRCCYWYIGWRSGCCHQYQTP